VSDFRKNIHTEVGVKHFLFSKKIALFFNQRLNNEHADRIIEDQGFWCFQG